MSRARVRILLIVCCLGVAAGGVTWVLRSAAVDKPRATALKLQDLSGPASAFAFCCPTGFHFSLVLGVQPETSQSQVEFSGEVVLRAGRAASLALQVDSASARPCNWLAGHGLEGFILNWPRNSRGVDLDCLLNPGERVSVEAKLSGLTPGRASLWLWYYQRARDR